jgi:leucyl-tRNA synthetase
MEENQAGQWVPSPAVQEVPLDKAQLKILHATIKKVGEDIESLSFNTAISQMMIFVNAFIPANPRPLSALKALLQVLNPFAPHLTEELWEQIHAGAPAQPLASAPWPQWDAQFLVEDDLEIPVQVNGKLRDKIVVPRETSSADIEQAALSTPKVLEHTTGKTIRKIIVVPGKLVNIVAN